MAEKKPLSLEAGVPTQLSSSDTLPAANMPYAMDQPVRTTDTITVANATAGGHAVNRDTGDGRYGRLSTDNNLTGNLGVGRTPDVRLDVLANEGLPVARLQNNDTTNGFGLKINAGGSAANRYALLVANQADSDDFLRVSTETGKVGRLEAFKGVDVTGAITVITTTPIAASLTSNGSNGGNPTLLLSDTTNGVDIVLSSSAGKAEIGTFGAHPLILRTSNTDRVTLPSAGGMEVTGAGSFTTGVVVATGQDVLENNKQDTYTATLTCGTSGTITLNSTLGDTLSYTRIGNMCHVTGFLTASSVSSPLGSLTLNLPLVSANTAKRSAWACGKISIAGAATKNINEFDIIISNSSSTALIYITDAGVYVDAAAEIQGGGFSDIRISFSYPVA